MLFMIRDTVGKEREDILAPGLKRTTHLSITRPPDCDPSSKFLFRPSLPPMDEWPMVVKMGATFPSQMMEWLP